MVAEQQTPATEREPAQPAGFDFRIPPPKMLTHEEELALAQVALARTPETVKLRLQVARLLVELDRFDQALALLDAWNVDDYRFHDLQATAHMSLETPANDLELERHCRRTVELSRTPLERANALSLLAKALTRQDDAEQARVYLKESLELHLHGKDAYKRAVTLDLKDGQAERVVELADQMVASGVTHSRVLCSQSLALAQLGMIEQARAAQGLDRFLKQLDPEPPAGWASREDFNRDLAAELGRHPGVRFGRYGTASARTWRIDEPLLHRTRVVPAQQQLVKREVERYVADLPADDRHPFLLARPAAVQLRNWCVITEGDGHETWHVHQNGWLSGVYYAYVQDHIAEGTGPEGCIAFGLPGELVGEQNAEAFGELVCRPHTGLMMIFPSHCFHRTFPHHGDGRRICYAFDLIPVAAESPVPEPAAGQTPAGGS